MGSALDRLWVGHSKIWVIEGMEGIPYIKPWKTVLVKRGLATSPVSDYCTCSGRDCSAAWKFIVIKLYCMMYRKAVLKNMCGK